MCKGYEMLKYRILNFHKMLLIFLLSFSSLLADSTLFKSGFYTSIAGGVGYYYYGEVNYLNKPVMKMDMALLNLALNLGYAKSGGKIDLEINANVAWGKYTGGVLDTSDSTQNGKKLTSIDTNSFYSAELKGGFDILSLAIESATLYLQSGIGYYFNRNDFMTFERLQGYLYVPLQLESEIYLNSDWALNLMAGYNFFILGNHLSKVSKQHFSGDLNVTQKGGSGASAFIGAIYKTSSGNINSFRLEYNFWSIDASPSTGDITDYAGNLTRLYEPKNTTHIITLKYIWRF